VLDRQGVATRHSGGYGEETQRSRSGYGAARMPWLLRDMALVNSRALRLSAIVDGRIIEECPSVVYGWALEEK